MKEIQNTDMTAELKKTLECLKSDELLEVLHQNVTEDSAVYQTTCESLMEAGELIEKYLIPNLKERARKERIKKAAENFTTFFNLVGNYSEELCSIIEQEGGDLTKFFSTKRQTETDEHIKNLKNLLDVGTIAHDIDFIDDEHSYNYEAEREEIKREITYYLLPVLEKQARMEGKKQAIEKITTICRALAEHAEEICAVIDVDKIGL